MNPVFLYFGVTASIILLGILLMRKKYRKGWPLILLIILLANIAVYYLTSHKSDENIATTEQQQSEVRAEFITSIKKNPAVLRAVLTDQGYLAVTVKNDGRDKAGLASDLCAQAKAQNFIIASVKVLDAADTKFGEGYAYGTELAEAVCN